MTICTKNTIAIALAGALAAASTAPSVAAPVMTSVAQLGHAASARVTNVAWRGRGFGPGLAAGLATGLFIGSAVAARPYGPDYYYEGPAYPYEPVYPAPGYYYAPSYGYGQCYTNDGYGRRRPCDAN